MIFERKLGTNRFNIKSLATIIFTAILIFMNKEAKCSTPSKGELEDMQTVKNNIIALNSNLSSEQLIEVEEIVNKMQQDGSWVELDYKSKVRAKWPPFEHAYNIFMMTQAWSTPNHSKTKSKELLNKIVVSLKFWLENDFTSDNWWFNDIGVPRYFSVTLILLEKDINPQIIKDFMKVLNRAEIRMTGQNLIWMSKITVHRALLQKNAELVRKATKEIYNTINTTSEEGLRYDGSFFQHGKLLYSLGYGVAFVEETSAFALEMSNTSFAMPEEKLNLIEKCVLDGQRWMYRKGTGDYGANGRAMTRMNISNKTLLQACKNLIEAGSTRKTELLELIEQFNKKCEFTVIGNKHFYMSDFMTHHRPDFYSSARMFSKRVLNTDTPHNKEGLKNEHVADGCNYLMRHGNEYTNIFPVWDWAKIPGTTVVQDDDGTLKSKIKGNTSFVGGCSDGNYGVASFDMKRTHLTAKKSWFFFDKQYVCLGAGINSNSKEKTVTTVNQCNLLSHVEYKFKDRQEKSDKVTASFNTSGWIWQDKVAYIFPENQDIELRADIQKGSWFRINESLSKEEKSIDVFKLYINHGATPNNENYNYIVAPYLYSISPGL